MMLKDHSLCFAIVGHPNEGKSSVVSTLSEDDSVSVSPYPGETRIKQIFPFRLDGKEILRFIDTPGFQRPGAVLEWIKARDGLLSDPVADFIREFSGNKDFRDEMEIFESISSSSGIIYVADCSKPLRRQDKFEMEILRLTGRPRMAVLNSKEDGNDFVQDWKNEFMKNFNSVRIFNAHKALWVERLDLLDSLRLMDQAWSTDLSGAINNLKTDWDKRISEASMLITEMLEACLGYFAEGTVSGSATLESSKKKLVDSYRKKISEIEKKTHSGIRSLFRHRVFDVELSDAPEIKSEDLFSKSTWKVLGLNPGQLAAAGGAAGASVGAVVDIAAHGLTMGAFTAIGAIAGAAGAWLKGEDMVTVRAAGMPIGGYRVKAGPCKNIQLMYVLMDRAMMYFSHMVKRPHGLRHKPFVSAAVYEISEKSFLSRNWDSKRKKTATRFFASFGSGQRQSQIQRRSEIRNEMDALIRAVLDEACGN